MAILPSQLLISGFKFQPTYGQSEVFKLLDEFICSESDEKQVFILKGYAGTGKTSIISRLTEILPSFGLKFMMLAPTGRAAKVMSGYSGKRAFTIHKQIYIREGEEGASELYFRKRTNINSKTVFIVDEASMISDESGVGERGLLADLFDFVFEKKSNRLIIVGDTAQLPPVKQLSSPALDADLLRSRYRVEVKEYELTEVVRQQAQSGILENATVIRNSIRKNQNFPQLSVRGFSDVFKMTGERIEEGINYAYSKFGIRNSIVITRSNKLATEYNKFIRSRINYSEEEIQKGDFLIVVRNNYKILPKEISGGFLANGDFVEIMRVKRTQEEHGFRFADVTLKLVDEPGEPEFDAKIILNLLYSNTPSLSQEENQKLYQSVLKDYQEIKSRKDRKEALDKDPFLNAIQVKFAYALTCHKSQGGQWDAVFIDQGFLPEEQIDQEFLRWLYTAITRGTKEVFMVNFNSSFF